LRACGLARKKALLPALLSPWGRPVSAGLLGDAEHDAIVRIDPGGALRTLFKGVGIRWPDGFSFGPDGWLYVTDSALQDVVLRGAGFVRDRGPYGIFRFRPDRGGYPGQ